MTPDIFADEIDPAIDRTGGRGMDCGRKVVELLPGPQRSKRGKNRSVRPAPAIDKQRQGAQRLFEIFYAT